MLLYPSRATIGCAFHARKKDLGLRYSICFLLIHRVWGYRDWDEEQAELADRGVVGEIAPGACSHGRGFPQHRCWSPGCCLFSSWGSGSVGGGVTAAVAPGAEISGVSSKIAWVRGVFPGKLARCDTGQISVAEGAGCLVGVAPS